MVANWYDNISGNNKVALKQEPTLESLLNAFQKYVEEEFTGTNEDLAKKV